MNTVAIIPARSGSKGLPNKNVKKLGGHPLIAWSIRAALLCPDISKTIVSTDSQEYAAIARDYGAEVPFLRPEIISKDNSTDLEFLEHYLDFISGSMQKVDLIAHIRPTTPLRKPSLFSEAINIFAKTPDSSALRSAHEMSESSYKTLEISSNGFFKRIMAKDNDLESANHARQAFPKTYYANGYIDLLRTDLIINQRKIHGNAVIPFITPFTQEIDNHEDFKIVEYYLKLDNSIQNLLF